MTHKLSTHLDATGESVPAFASRVGTSRQTIHRIIKGTARPSADMIAKIIEATGDVLTFSDLYVSEAVA